MNSFNLATKHWWPPDEAAAAQYMAYAEEFGQETSLAQVDAVIGGSKAAYLGNASGAELAGFLRTRIKDREPTSLIRLGDADGNVLFSSMGKYGDLAKYNLMKISQIYFGNKNLMPDHHEFFASIVEGAIRDADVIGGPERGSVDRSFTTPLDELDVRGMCGMRGVYNFLADEEYLGILKDKIWASTWFSRALLPHYVALLRDQKYLGMITCYPELGPALQAKANIAQTETLLVPMQASIAKSSRDIGHYPEAYPKILEQIKPPFQGAIYIVAAGILSKPYCSAIKQRGGIAIDVGSVADIWMGTKSRPGVVDSFVEKWSLLSRPVAG